MSKPEIDVVLAGAGSKGAAEEGVLSVIRRHFTIVRVGGASAGSINAAADAAGIPAAGLWKEFLTAGNLEDYHMPLLKPMGILFSSGRGMMAGKVIYNALRKNFGDLKMGDLKKPCRIVVGNLAKRKIEVIDSENPAHKGYLVADVVRCSSAVPFVMDAWQIDPKSATLYTDGGTGANSPAGLWDDEADRPTLEIKFKNSDTAKPVKSLKDFVAAIFDIRQDASEDAFASKKEYVYTIEIDINADSLDFSLDPKEVDRRRTAGIVAAQRFINSHPELLVGE